MKNTLLLFFGIFTAWFLFIRKKTTSEKNAPAAIKPPVYQGKGTLIAPGSGPYNPDIQTAYQSVFYTPGALKQALAWSSNGKVVVGVPSVYGDTFYVGDSIILNIGVVGPYQHPGKVLSKGKGVRTYEGETTEFIYLYTDIAHDGSVGDRPVKLFKLG